MKTKQEMPVIEMETGAWSVEGQVMFSRMRDEMLEGSVPNYYLI